jgi:hypothetical protein
LGEAFPATGGFFNMFNISVLVLSLLISSMAMASNTTIYDQSLADKRKTQTTEFIKWMNEVSRLEKLSENDIAQHFSPGFKYYINGKLVKQIPKIQFPVRDIVMDGNKVAASYVVSGVDKNGVAKRSDKLILITFDDSGKVAEFFQSS